MKFNRELEIWKGFRALKQGKVHCHRNKVALVDSLDRAESLAQGNRGPHHHPCCLTATQQYNEAVVILRLMELASGFFLVTW